MNPAGGEILAKCNQHLQANGPTKKYVFDKTMTVTFLAETDWATNMNNVATEAGETGYQANADEWRREEVGPANLRPLFATYFVA